MKEDNNLHPLKVLQEKDWNHKRLTGTLNCQGMKHDGYFCISICFLLNRTFFLFVIMQELEIMILWTHSQKQITRRTRNKYSPTSTLLFVCVDFWVAHHGLSILLPCMVAGAYTLARARGRCSSAGENKMKPDTLVVSCDWMGRAKKMWASPRVVKISV